ncbi:hypothetical protein DXV75_05630 [Alteromonas aestuariivivens]|uniref:Uncharacterized protein n=1 Tax=Alteromonas aestuariivivens TaxID=1938339 RepID=A0A3D8MBB6_9ALTE|nr:hypothetical protein [Alteromonas aestuariivivens]RDV27507.1 hypothetical protein DXV75_05630 [Alteromonas aestuariivivens]
MRTNTLDHHIQYKKLGAALLFLMIMAILILILRLDWLNMPLSANHVGADIRLFGLSMPIIVLIGYLLAIVLGLMHFQLGLPFLLLPPLLGLCWPVIIANETSGLLPTFFEEARARSLVEQVFRLQVQNNFNMQPTYTAVYDVRSVLERTVAILSNLSFGWYAFVIMGLLMPLVFRLITQKKQRTTLYYLTVGLVVMMIFSFYYARDPYRLSGISADASRSVQLIEHCGQKLKENPELSQSDYFVTQCARAYSNYAGWAGPVSHIPVIYDFMGNNNFLYLSQHQFAEMEQRLTPLLYLPVHNDLDKMFLLFAMRHYRMLQNIRALDAIKKQDYNLAANMLTNTAWFREDVSSWILFGYARSKQGQLHDTISSFEEAVQELNNHTVIANLYCTLGDTMVSNTYFEQARYYYQQCIDFDSEGNYWAVSGLGGT